MAIEKWKLLSSKDVSPSPWFPIEERTYELPNGKIIDDFTVSTLADVAMIIPVTPDEKVILVRQYKPGYDDVILEFPAGRKENFHADIKTTAFHELEEETGIVVDELEFFGIFSGFVTKCTEKIHCYLAKNAVVTREQKLDITEDIEVVMLGFDEVETLIAQNEMNAALSVAAWDLAKRKFSDIFSSWNAK